MVLESYYTPEVKDFGNSGGSMIEVLGLAVAFTAVEAVIAAMVIGLVVVTGIALLRRQKTRSNNG